MHLIVLMKKTKDSEILSLYLILFYFFEKIIAYIIDKKSAKQSNLLAIGHEYNPVENKTTSYPLHQTHKMS
jgi:hypothetical protein